MSIKKQTQPSLKERLRQLFARKSAPASQPVQIISVAPVKIAEQPGQQKHSKDDMAFSAGADVAFITPIGAYAGNKTDDALRRNAMQQFQHMEHSHTTTIN